MISIKTIAVSEVPSSSVITKRIALLSAKILRASSSTHFSLLLLGRYDPWSISGRITCWLFSDQNSQLSFKFDIEKKGSGWIYAENRGTPHPDPLRDCPLRPLEGFRALSPDINFLQDFKAGELVVSAGTSILAEDSRSAHLFTILSGWAFRYRTLEDGRRQIINYALPGDFVGLQAALTNPMSHGVEALTDIVLCVFPRDKMWNVFVNHPEIAYDITWLAAREERTLDEHLLSIGRKTALERLAYLLWFLFDKARGVALVKGNKLVLPMSQLHLADTLGLSRVHTNKALQKLRENGSIILDGRTLKIVDEEALKALGRVEAVVPARRPLI